jgi:hypothetical protein
MMKKIPNSHTGSGDGNFQKPGLFYGIERHLSSFLVMLP